MAWLGRNGVDGAKQVVAYDFAAGSRPARLWWMLRWVGHERVAVLDGGWEGMDQGRVSGHRRGAARHADDVRRGSRVRSGSMWSSFRRT